MEGKCIVRVAYITVRLLTLSHRPIVNLAFIDEVFYSKSRGTLAQQALWRGDRMLFHLLVREYGANVTLPFLRPRHTEQLINCYAAVVHTDHHDRWFW